MPSKKGKAEAAKKLAFKIGKKGKGAQLPSPENNDVLDATAGDPVSGSDLDEEVRCTQRDEEADEDDEDGEDDGEESQHFVEDDTQKASAASASPAKVIVLARPDVPKEYAPGISLQSKNANNLSKLQYQVEVTSHLEKAVRTMDKKLQALEAQVRLPAPGAVSGSVTRSSPPKSKRGGKAEALRQEGDGGWPPFKQDGSPDGAQEPWKGMFAKAGDLRCLSVACVVCCWLACAGVGY